MLKISSQIAKLKVFEMSTPLPPGLCYMQIRIRKDTKAKLQTYADRLGVLPNFVVQRAIESYLLMNSTANSSG